MCSRGRDVDGSGGGRGINVGGLNVDVRVVMPTRLDVRGYVLLLRLHRLHSLHIT